MKGRRLLAGLVVLAALAACGGGNGVDGVSVPDVTPTSGSEGSDTSGRPPTTFSAVTSLTPSTTPGTSVTGNPIDPELPLVQAAVEDLAQRLDVPTEDITVVKALAVTWPDRSLGCPEPGMAYIQVQVDGALVVLEAGGRRYEYHGGDPLALCEQAK